jgi:hypothetical protein
MMDTQQLLNIKLSTVMVVIGWFARELWAAVKELKADLSKMREDLPKVYLAKDDYRSDLKDIRDMLGKIFDKLDAKQDK